MEGAPAIYLGRIVEKKNFRAFIYGANGEQRLVESWEEFEANMQSGIWFATPKNSEPLGVNKELKPKKKSKIKADTKPDVIEEVSDVDDVDDVDWNDDKSVFEVID